MAQKKIENSEPTYRKVLHDQTEAMLDFLEKHPQLVLKKCRPLSGKLWGECAEILNAISVGGPYRTGQQWSKYFSDWKYRVRRKALELKAVAEGFKAVEGLPPLTPIEEKLLMVIGDKTLKGLVVTSDPFIDIESDDEEDFCVPLTPIPTKTGKTNNEDVIRLPLETSSKPESEALGNRKRKRPQTPEVGGAGCKREQLHMNGDGDSLQDLDNEIPTEAFFHLEERKLKSGERLVDTLRGVRIELARAVDVLTDIKDWLVSR